MKSRIFATLLTSALIGQAATVSITTADGSGADTHVRNDVAGNANANLNYGSAISMLVGSNAGNSPNGLINLFLRFDLAGLQAASGGQPVTINSVTLSITTTGSAGGASGGLPFTVGVHDYAGNFVEGTANGATQSGSSTWNNPFGDSSDTTPGGTTGTQLQSLSIGNVGINTTWTFSTSTGFVSDVQGAYSPSGASVVNYLLKEIDTGTDWATDQSFLRIVSGEASTGVKPTLTIDYTVIPEPTAALLGGLGLLAMLRRRRA